MLAKQVPPPSPGTSQAWMIETKDGTRRKEESEYHISLPRW